VRVQTHNENERGRRDLFTAILRLLPLLFSCLPIPNMLCIAAVAGFFDSTTK
jgi:hypothetical protein